MLLQKSYTVDLLTKKNNRELTQYYITEYCQHSPTLLEETLHQAILQCVQSVVEDKEDILKNLRDVQENIILFSENQVTPQSLEKEIDKLQQELSALVKIVAQGGDSDFYAAKLW